MAEPPEFYRAALDGLADPPQAVLPAIRLAEEIRALAAAAVASTAPADELAAVTREVHRLAGRLGGAIAAAGGGRRALELAGPAARYLFHPTYGPANPAAVPIRVEYADGVLTGRASFGGLAEGRFGEVHWSAVTAGVLGLVSLVAVTNGYRGRLRELDVRYLCPAPLGTEVTYEVAVADISEVEARVVARIRCPHADVLEASAVVVREQ